MRRRRWKLLPAKVGLPVLGVWLIATGLMGLAPQFAPAHSDTALAALAVAAGALIVLGL